MGSGGTWSLIFGLERGWRVMGKSRVWGNMLSCFEVSHYAATGQRIKEASSWFKVGCVCNSLDIFPDETRMLRDGCCVKRTLWWYLFSIVSPPLLAVTVNHIYPADDMPPRSTNTLRFRRVDLEFRKRGLAWCNLWKNGISNWQALVQNLNNGATTFGDCIKSMRQNSVSWLDT